MKKRVLSIVLVTGFLVSSAVANSSISKDSVLYQNAKAHVKLFEMSDFKDDVSSGYVSSQEEYIAAKVLQYLGYKNID